MTTWTLRAVVTVTLRGRPFGCVHRCHVKDAGFPHVLALVCVSTGEAVATYNTRTGMTRFPDHHAGHHIEWLRPPAPQPPPTPQAQPAPKKPTPPPPGMQSMW